MAKIFERCKSYLKRPEGYSQAACACIFIQAVTQTDPLKMIGTIALAFVLVMVIVFIMGGGK